ncbi:hypothetical protein PS862_00044 [Pseudomonas fluorescens]|uniref:Uncharacterized protein n=1 Tax=Pseudomonas fluorescens TaxID=294 RepID=A0A5E7G623_PSEFL|nr:hypothetical protein [Pseudomonas fluorescens]VVO45957.1 hypothetical protein PS862_00044 [Pseudomonas fluorescens]
MSFFMITYGSTQVEELYIGRTGEEVVARARELIDQWPEYLAMSDEEILELAKAGELEFDLVEIHAPWPGDSIDHHELINIYELQQAR